MKKRPIQIAAHQRGRLNRAMRRVTENMTYLVEMARRETARTPEEYRAAVMREARRCREQWARIGRLGDRCDGLAQRGIAAALAVLGA